MKKYSILIILICFFGKGYAQQVGVYGNTVLSKQSSDFYESDFFLSSSLGIDYHWRNDYFFKHTLSLAYERKGENINNLGEIKRNRINYMTLKYLLRIGNSNIDFQIGPYLSLMTNANSTYYGVTDDNYIVTQRRFDFGLSSNINQYLFKIDNLSFYLRGEINYGIPSISKDFDFINFQEYYERNLSCGLGLSARWNFKE